MELIIWDYIIDPHLWEGYSKWDRAGSPTPFLPTQNLCKNYAFASVYRISIIKRMFRF